MLYLLAGYNAFVLLYILARYNVNSFHYTCMLLSKSDTENRELSWRLSSQVETNAVIVTNSVTVTLASGRLFVVNVMFGLFWNCVYVYALLITIRQKIFRRCDAKQQYHDRIICMRFSPMQNVWDIAGIHHWPLLLTWFNFSPSMDK